MSPKNQEKSVDGSRFRFWTPPAGSTIEVGPDRLSVPLPQVPLPLHSEQTGEEPPSADAIGSSVYDYLRQFPDSPHNLVYAQLLRDAFPHFLADLGSHLAMLDHKEVDATYVRRKITAMKILALVEPGNAGLWRQMGIAAFEMALMFSELIRCRRYLLEAIGYLQRAASLDPGDLSTLNYLAQIDYYLGDYPTAGRRWQAVVDRLPEGPAREALSARLARIAGEKVPDHPLVDDLEAIGAAMAACGDQDFPEALRILEALEEEGSLPAECPMPEFYHLLGLCRSKSGDAGGAFAAFDQALAIDPDYQPALAGRDCILEGRSL